MLVTHEEIYEKWIKTHCSYCWRRKFRGLKCLLNKNKSEVEVEVFEQWDETHCSKCCNKVREPQVPPEQEPQEAQVQSSGASSAS